MRAVAAAAIAVLACASMRPAADAHPLGNFTSNHLSRIAVRAHAIDVHYVLDDAEIPAFSLLRALDAHGRPSQTTLDAWAVRHAREIASELMLSVDGSAAPLVLDGTHVRLRPGAAGLSTLYFDAEYHAPRHPGAVRISYADATLPGRIGWKDVVVEPNHEPTRELTSYPSALLGSPRDRTSIAMNVAAGGLVEVVETASPLVAGVASTARMNGLSDVLARNLSDPLVLLGALVLAIGLGALHALEPGHGKTLLAVSLVGARATVRQAIVLAGALTFAHTVGVLMFGAVVLTLARYVVPEALYPWIALLSGAFVAVLGARALSGELARRSHERRHAELHAHGRAHDHDHHHEHGHSHAIPGTAPLGFRTAVLAASSGNLAPCPAALVVLLAAIATHKIGWGLILIVAFSLGLALTLTLLGIAVVRGAAWLTQRPQFARVAASAPLVTAVAISVIGAWMVGEGVAAQGIAVAPALVAAAVLTVILALIAVQTTSGNQLKGEHI